MKKFLFTTFLLIFTQFGFSQNNYSLSFDGYGDYVDLGNNALFDFQYGDSFTISMWIYSSGLGGDKGLISKMADNGPVQYEVITAGTSIRYGTGNQFLFGGQLEAGNWYHLIVTSDGSAKNIYINNQLIESGTFESMTSNGDNLYIGAHQPLAMPGWSWSGFIDEVSIWNVAFTQNDIDSYATNSLSGNENGLVCYYKFNEGSGSTLIDDGPNGINGNINGAIWSTGVPALPNPDLQVLDLNIQVELESGGCAKHYYTPETDIGLQQNKIEEIYVSYESSNSVDCGGICGSTHLNLEILDQDGNILEGLYSGDCFTPGTSGNVIFYPNTASTSTIAPTLHLYTVDLQANSSATITGVGFSPVYGCTTPYATNYDANASVDDGGCIFEENNFSQTHTVFSWDNDISDYQVLFEVDFIEGMSFDYSDILFVDMSNNVLPSFVESYDQNSAKIWVKTNILTANVQNEILMFYGNSNFQNDNDPNDVFISYENFDNNNFSGSWTVNTQGGASYQFEDGKLRLNVTQTDNFVSVDSESNYSLAEGVALSAKVKVQNSRGHFALGIADGNSKERTNNGGYNFLNGFTFGTGNGGPANFRAINGGQVYDGNAGGSESAIANDFVELEIKKLSNEFLELSF